MPKEISKKIAILFCAILLTIISKVFVLAWIEPAEYPPNGNVSSPINVSITNQSKAGNFSIGTTASYAPLTVDGPYSDTAGARKTIEIVSSGTNEWWSFGLSELGNLMIDELSGTDTNVMSLTTGGNVGIGVLGPLYKLDVLGGGRFTDPVFVGTPVLGGHAVTRNYVDSLFGGDSIWDLSGTSAYYDEGNVGIGTTNPGVKLEVINSGAGQALNISSAFTSINGANKIFSAYNNGILRTELVDSGIQRWYLSTVGSIQFSTPGGSPGLVFFTGATYNQNRFNVVNRGTYFNLGFDADSGGTAGLNIRAGGSVGIGDTDPDGTLKLDVEGQVGATAYCEADGTNCQTVDQLLAGSGSGVPAGVDGQIQYNNAGVFGGASSLYYDATNGLEIIKDILNINVAPGLVLRNSAVGASDILSPAVYFEENCSTSNFSDYMGRFYSAYGYDFRFEGSNDNGASWLPVARFTTGDSYVSTGEFGQFGIGNTSPAYPLDVTGDANATRLCIAGDCRGVWPSDGAGDNLGDHTATENIILGTTHWLSGDGDDEGISIDEDGFVTINKLYVTTIDPIYEIEGEKYASYVSDFVGGVRTETSGVLQIKDQLIINFDNQEKGSDLWLFWETSNKKITDLVVILTPGFDGKVWYKKQDNKLIILTNKKGEVSFRLTMPRHDDEDWPTLLEK